MLVSVGAGLMSVDGLIGLFVGAHPVDVCDESNISGKTFSGQGY